MGKLIGEIKNQTKKRRFTITITYQEGREEYEIDKRVIEAESVREALKMAYPKIFPESN